VPSRKIGNQKVLSISTNKKGQQVIVLNHGRLVLSANAFTEHPLYVGKEVTALEYRDIVAFQKNEGLYNYALSLASKGCYSTHDLREKLSKKTSDVDQVRQALFRLRQQNLLDDEAFAKEYAEEKSEALYGRDRILQELRFKHGINETIAFALSFPHEEENAKKAAQLLEKKYARLPLKAKRQKGSEALVRRGYSQSVASLAVMGYKEDTLQSQKSLTLLAENTLKRYEKKYNGYDLRSKCFAYLLKKGYRSEDIAHALEELL
jgi:regulatory protein